MSLRDKLINNRCLSHNYSGLFSALLGKKSANHCLPNNKRQILISVRFKCGKSISMSIFIVYSLFSLWRSPRKKLQTPSAMLIWTKASFSVQMAHSNKSMHRSTEMRLSLTFAIPYVSHVMTDLKRLLSFSCAGFYITLFFSSPWRWRYTVLLISRVFLIKRWFETQAAKRL